MKKIFEIDMNVTQAEKAASDLYKELESLKQVNKELIAETKGSTEAMDKNANSIVANKAVIKEMGKQYREAEAEISRLTNVKKQEKQLTDDINGLLKKEVKTRGDAKLAIKELNKLKDQLNVKDEKQAKLLKEVNKQVDKNTDFLKENSSEIEKQKINIGNYKEDITSALDEINPFNTAVKKQDDSFKRLGASVKGAAKETMKFLLSPIGLLLTFITSVGLATNEIFKYNASIRETQILTESLTNTTGEAADQIRISAGAIAESFDKDIKEVLVSARSVVNSFGVSYSEALDMIQSGLIQGGAANEEYLESLKEFSVFFAEAGYTAEEFNRVIQAGADVGIFKDKLPDAIKEFELSIKEATTASRDALNNAFGDEFTNKLFSNIQDGSITSKDALALISTEAETIGLNAQQAQQLTADLFRGAGEDAGGALKIFEAINIALSDEVIQLTAVEEQIRELAEANETLAYWKDEALKSDSIISFKNNVDILWKTIKTGWYYWINNVATTFTDMFDDIAGFFSGMGGGFSAFRTELQNTASIAAQFGGIIKNAFTLNFEEAKAGFDLLKENISNITSSFSSGFTDAYNLAIENRQATRDALVELENQYNEEDKIIKEENDVKEAEIRQAQKQVVAGQMAGLTAIKKEALEKQTIDLGISTKEQEAIQKEHAEFVEMVEREKSLSKSQSLASDLGSVASALGEETAIGKLAAATQAGINIQVGITKALASKGIAGILEGIAITAAGAKSLSKIASSPTSYYTGGKISDGTPIPRHLQNEGGDDVLIQAKKGEVVLNKEQQYALGGNQTFSNIGVPGFYDGGIIGGLDTANESTFQSIDITSQMSSIKVINVASETAEMYDDVMKVENLANV